MLAQTTWALIIALGLCQFFLIYEIIRNTMNNRSTREAGILPHESSFFRLMNILSIRKINAFRLTFLEIANIIPNNLIGKQNPYQYPNRGKQKMPLVKKPKQITVDVSELTIELDEKLTAQLEQVAETEGTTAEDYVLGLLKEHFSPKSGNTAAPEAAAGATKTKTEKSPNVLQILNSKPNKAELAQQVLPVVENHNGTFLSSKASIINKLNNIINNGNIGAGPLPRFTPELEAAIKQAMG